VKISIQRLPHALDLPLPFYATEGSAGLDLLAANDQPMTLAPGGRTAVPCGIAIALPPGFEAQVRPRSGLALHHGVTVLNAPGTVDSDYRGEVAVLLVNLSEVAVPIAPLERIAQLVIAPVAHAELVVSPIGLEATARGTGGYGSTGSA
jgi:dUTP pyrophosphatase